MAVPWAAIAAITQVALGVGGAAFKIAGAKASAQTAQFEAQYAQRVHEFNAAAAMQNASLIEQSAVLERVRAGKIKQAFLGAQRAQFAKAGVRTMEGTPFDVLVETAAELELDIEIDYFNSQVSAHAQRTQAELDRAQGAVARYNEVIAKQQRRLAPVIIGLDSASRIVDRSVSVYNALAKKP